MRLPFVVGILIGALLGVAGTVMFRSSSLDSLPPASQQAAGSDRTDRGAQDGTAGTRGSGRDAAGSQPTPRVDATAAGSPDLDAALRSLTAGVEIPTGTGTIRGRVATGDGQPVSGAKIQISARGAPEGHEYLAAHNTDFTRYMQNEGRYHKWQRALHRETATGADGVYSFTGLPAIPFGVEASAEGFEVQIDRESDDFRGRGDGFTPDCEVNFTATRAIPITFEVRNADGSTPEKATIQTSVRMGGGSSRSHFDWSPASPTQPLTAGRYTISAESGDARAEPVTLVLDAGSKPETVALVLGAATGIRGVVVLPADEVPAQRFHSDVSVRVLSLARGRDPSPAEVAQGQAADVDDKSFTLKLKPGEYVVGAGRSYRAIEVMTRVTVGDQMENIELVIPPLRRSDAYVVRVYGPDGGLMKNVSFSPSMRSARGSRSGGDLGEVRKSDGSFWIPRTWFLEQRLEAKDAPDVRYELEISAEDSGKTRVAIDPENNMKDIECRLDEGCYLTATLAGVEESLAPYVHLALRADESGDRSESPLRENRHDEAREAGVFHFGPLVPGAYELLVQVSPTRESFWGGLPASSQTVEIGPGEQQLIVRCPPLYEVIVDALELAAGTEVSLAAAGEEPMHLGRGIQIKVGSDGQIVIPAMPPGDFVLRHGWGHSAPSMKFTVRGTTHLDWAPTTAVINAFKVHIESAGGVLGQAGFEDGDLITAIDGTAFENEQQISLLFAAAMTQESSRVSVLRGEETIDLTVNLSRLNGEMADLGGYVVPATQPSGQ